MWKRNCPKCGEEIPYTRKFCKDRAEKRNRNCHSCVMKSEKVRKRMSKSHIGMKHSKETCERMSKSQKGRKCSEKTRKKISESRKGIIFTDEHKKNISNSKKGQIPWNKGKSEIYSEKTIRKMRKNHKNSIGKNNGMYGKSVYDIWLEKYGKEEADKRQKQANKKVSEKNKGQVPWNKGLTKENDSRLVRSENIRKNYRLAAIKRIEKQYGQISPNYNLNAIPIIEEYGRKHGFNFRHAENGGEKCIGGYFPDGIDEKRKTIIEVDESHHFNSDGNLKERDVQRQRYLEGLGYKFIRIKI